MTMTKADRQQLQTLIRRRFRVLRSDIEQRQAELLADMETQISQRYADDDQTWKAARHEVHEAILEANRRVNDAWRRAIGDDHEEADYVRMIGVPPQRTAAERHQLRRTAIARIDEQVHDAKLKLERQEVELLERLLVGGLESDEARAFLDTIPTVGELVPASRLAELDAGAQWEAADDG